VYNSLDAPITLLTNNTALWKVSDRHGSVPLHRPGRFPTSSTSHTVVVPMSIERSGELLTLSTAVKSVVFLKNEWGKEITCEKLEHNRLCQY
jgi:hypothetical protein